MMMKNKMMLELEHSYQSEQGRVSAWKKAHVVQTVLTDLELTMVEEVLARGLKNPQMKMDKTWTGQGEPIVNAYVAYVV